MSISGSLVLFSIICLSIPVSYQLNPALTLADPTPVYTAGGDSPGNSYYEVPSPTGETIIKPFGNKFSDLLLVGTGILGFGLSYLLLHFCCTGHSGHKLRDICLEEEEDDKLKLEEPKSEPKKTKTKFITPQLAAAKNEDTKKSTVQKNKEAKNSTITARNRRSLKMDATARKIICATENGDSVEKSARRCNIL